MESSVALSYLQVVLYIRAGFLALQVYDSLLQIHEEYLHVWKSRWTLVKGLYLWARYCPIIVTAISVSNGTACNKVATFSTAFSGITIAATELILMVRTYTLYERSKKLLAFFFLLWFILGGIAGWAVTRWTSGFTGMRFRIVASLSLLFTRAVPTTNSLLPPCWFSDPNTIGVGLVCYIVLLAGETAIVLLTLWKVFRKFHHNKSGLWKSFYCDGVWFYLAIWPWTVLVVVVLYAAPVGLNNFPDTPLLVMHSVLSCRLITHAREIAAEEDRRACAVNKIFKERHMMSENVVDISPHDKV
ncbi:hypothetical protein C8R47DRAFT_1133340 [Mycena vitilis]|nr:hypothetical protein C8R47DRAFT_1133340 [Mycena vitilis]